MKEETQKLQEMLRQKESDLQKTEALLNNFHHEVQLLSQERARLIGLQNNLEQEMKTSAQAHQQLAEQKTENEKLKDIIDTLKVDLDEALFHHHTLDTVQEDEALEESHAFKVSSLFIIMLHPILYHPKRNYYFFLDVGK